MDNNNKFRLLYLYKILMEKSDINHPLTTHELMETIENEYKIHANRNTVTSDLNSLRNSGLSIEIIHGKNNAYYYDGRSFDTAELKILIDTVASSKFITEKKSRELIDKLLTLIPGYEAAALRRHVFAEQRVRSDNEKGYYIVDAINNAIEMKRKISFIYTDYDVCKEKKIRNGGEPYVMSPYALIWDGDFYYLRGYCDNRQAMRNFRIDRIYAAPTVLDIPADPEPDDFSAGTYRKAVFRMYDTDETVEVTLRCKKEMMNYVIDQFGMEAETIPVDEETFLLKAEVCISPTFFRWVFGFSDSIVIEGPDEVRKQYAERLKKAMEQLTGAEKR